MKFTEDKSDFQKEIKNWSFDKLFERWWEMDEMFMDDIFEEIIFRLNLENISYKYAKRKNDDLIQELATSVYESLFNYNPNKNNCPKDNLKSYIGFMLKHKARNYCLENVYNENISRGDTVNLTEYVSSLKKLESVNQKSLSKYALSKYREAEKYLKDKIYFLKISSSTEAYTDDMAIDKCDDVNRDTNNLSDNKKEIIKRLERGYSVREIATAMNVSHQTIYNRIDEIKKEVN